MARFDFRLPDLGEGLTEATVLHWLVGVGDDVALNQPLCEVETDKAQAEVPSPAAGRVAALGAAEGETIAVGALLVGFDVNDPASPDVPRAGASPAAPSGPVLVGSGPPPPSGAVVRRRRPVVAPTGPAPAPSLPLAVAAGVAPADESVAIGGIRVAMAERMRRSHREIPAAAAQREVGATVLLDTADQLTERSGVGVSPFSVLAGLTVMALSRHRWLNAVFDEPTASLTLRRRVNLAFAVDTPYGLMAPVVAHAETLTIVELAAEMNRLAAAARDRRVTPAEVSGATFTITNHGSVGTDDGMPIVNPPQVAILAVGAIRPRPFVVDGLVVAAPTVHLTCAFDHRCLDGGQAGRFLGDLADLLAAPVDPDVALGEG